MKPRVVELGRFVESTLTCIGNLRRVTSVTADPLTGADVPVYEDVFTGPCLVYALDQWNNVEVSGWTPTVSKYAVTLPAGTDAKVGDVFTATDSPAAPELVGVVLRITDTPLDAWQVALTCTAERLH